MKETIVKDKGGRIIEHIITITKAEYDEIVQDRKDFLQNLLTKLIDIDSELNKRCVASWKGLPPNEGRASWLGYLSKEENKIRYAVIMY